jgi:hypothetical protein
MLQAYSIKRIEETEEPPMKTILILACISLLATAALGLT